jgi:hypothetical protein
MRLLVALLVALVVAGAAFALLKVAASVAVWSVALLIRVVVLGIIIAGAISIVRTLRGDL